MKIAGLLAAMLVSWPLVAAAQPVGAPTIEHVPEDLADEVKSRGILGQDDRRSTREVPYYLKKYTRRVGELITYNHLESGETAKTTCTGSLIQKNYIVTAAHCAFDSQGKLHENQFFYPGIQEGRVNYDKYRVARVFLPASYTHDANEDTGRDIAIMELEPADNGRHAGQVAGWFGFWGRADFPDGEVSTIGYPGDKQDGHQYFQEGCQAVNRNPYNHNDLWIDCDVFQGQSGSPVLIYSGEYDTFHVQAVIQSESAKMNFGSRISPERAQIFRYITKGEFASAAYQSEGIVEPWIQMDYVNQNKIYVYARNECSDEDLYIAYNYKTHAGDWRAGGFMLLKPKHEMPVFDTGNGVYYLSARNPEGKVFTRKDMNKYLSKYDMNVGMQKYSVDKFGTFTYGFGCR